MPLLENSNYIKYNKYLVKLSAFYNNISADNTIKKKIEKILKYYIPIFPKFSFQIFLIIKKNTREKKISSLIN